MRHEIADYQNYPGAHCGSVAMRGLLGHYTGLELPESAVFGLGAGVASVLLTTPGLETRMTLFGRTISMEQDLARHLGIDYREQPEEDDDRAWEIVREEVLAGRPTMLSGDILYLDYREFKVHFPGHRFVLLGFDDEAEQVLIADRIRPESESCSMGALRKSRNPPGALSTHNLWGRFHSREIGTELVDAARKAIETCSSTMLGLTEADSADGAGLSIGDGEAPQFIQGVAATRAFAEAVPAWADAEDGRSLASYNASCIEKFGNGGGNFRRLYSGFLRWAHSLDSGLVPATAEAEAWAAADAWTAVSDALFQASRPQSDGVHFEEAARHARRVAELEEALFSRLAD